MRSRARGDSAARANSSQIFTSLANKIFYIYTNYIH